MKVFKNPRTAAGSEQDKEHFYLNSYCPYQIERLCGSRCALFYFYKGENSQYKKTSPHVILGCKAGEKLLFVNELVEE